MIAGPCFLIFAGCVALHDFLRVKHAKFAATNQKLDRILMPIGLTAAVIGLMVL